MELDWINLVAGFISGVISSLLVSKYFHWKGLRSEHRSEFHGYNTEMTLLNSQYPEYFSSSKAKRITFNQVPRNRDIPYLSEIIFKEYPLKAGNKHQALLRVSDDEWNFPMAKGIDASLLGSSVTVQDEAFGFMLLEFEIPKYAQNANYKIDCKLMDKVGNSNQQSIEIEIA